MNENITKVKLLYVPLDNEYKHTLYFANSNPQLLYFQNVATQKLVSDFSYQRKDSKLRVNLSFDESLKYNYCIYQNTAYNNKWFFAFITNYEWKNEGVTELTLETDVLQTWLEEITIMPSFVEREHTDNDNIVNTIPENLEIGEYICRSSSYTSALNTLNIVLAITTDTNKNLIKGAKYNGMYSGVGYKTAPNDEAGIGAINAILDLYSTAGLNDSIVSMFIAPSVLAPVEENHTDVLPSTSVYSSSFQVNNDNKYSNYPEMRNKKLLTFPYRYLLCSNNNGGSAIYQYEHFSDNEECTFVIKGVLTPGCSIRIYPTNYKGLTNNEEEGLNLGKFPICNWTSDEYTNWLTQNSVNIGLNLATGVGQVIAGGVMATATAGLGTVVGGAQIVGGVSAVTNQLIQIHQRSFTPAQSNGNVNCGDVITSMGSNNFVFYQMQCKPEYLKIIDEYFDLYGYKTNRVKIPFKAHRNTWWYTKTIDVNITGQIPIEDMNKIKACYNNGVTFWRDARNIKNYSLNNDTV